MNRLAGLIEEGEAWRKAALSGIEADNGAKSGPVSSWSSAEGAAQWRRSSSVRNAALVTATERMLARAGLRPGMRVLVLGAGSGDDAVMVADRVGSTGHVLATDLSPDMVDACRTTMRRLGLSWVDSRVMDVAAADVEQASFDAVVSRHGLMFTPHLDRALAGARSALRPGGRFSMTCWGPLGNNPMMAIALALAQSRGLPQAAPSEFALAFSLSDADALAEALARAGFADVVVGREPVAQRFASAGAAVGLMRRTPAAGLFAHLDDERRAEAWVDLERAYSRFETASGWVADGESLVASGVAPDDWTSPAYTHDNASETSRRLGHGSCGTTLPTARCG